MVANRYVAPKLLRGLSGFKGVFKSLTKSIDRDTKLPDNLRASIAATLDRTPDPRLHRTDRWAVE
jgi:hypothetical protein